MAVQLKLQPYQLRDLASVRDLGAARLRQALIDLDKSTQPLKPSDLHAILRSTLPGDVEKVDSLVRLLLSLGSLSRQHELSVTELLAGIRASLEASGWTDQELARWAEVETTFGSMVDSPKVLVVSKATDLTYDYANLLQTAKLITDIRPIFDKGANVIQGSVVSYTLRLHFDNREGNHSLSIALDEEDVLRLKAQCDRALRKAQLARTVMAGKAEIPTIIAGAKSDDI